jgi:hypothetical protein
MHCCAVTLCAPAVRPPPGRAGGMRRPAWRRARCASPGCTAPAAPSSTAAWRPRCHPCARVHSTRRLAPSAAQRTAACVRSRGAHGGCGEFRLCCACSSGPAPCRATTSDSTLLPSLVPGGAQPQSASSQSQSASNWRRSAPWRAPQLFDVGATPVRACLMPRSQPRVHLRVSPVDGLSKLPDKASSPGAWKPGHGTSINMAGSAPSQSTAGRSTAKP